MKRDNNDRKERKVEDKRWKEKDMILICTYKFFLEAKKRFLDHNKRRSSGRR